jgi:hypothetical protein
MLLDDTAEALTPDGAAGIVVVETAADWPLSPLLFTAETL